MNVNNKILHNRLFLPFFIFLLLLLSLSTSIKAQCPPNLNFEDGTFNGWECWVGSTYTTSGRNIIDLSLTPTPIPNRHVMYSANPGDGLDPWGGFPRNCPNGSGHSIRLGNDESPANAKAEGVSYTFTIPIGQTEFNLTYYYAIVIQDPLHQQWEQPRFVITVDNLTDGTGIPCSPDPFVPNGGLPGFKPSPLGQDVIYKGWAAATINLNNLEGKTIRLFFKTADCTFNAHFGYAYVDVSTECSTSFIGATFCPDDAFINVTAPFGYDSYTWYSDPTYTTVIGNTQTINFTPPPASGTQIYVKMEPFNGYGCTTNLRADLVSTLVVTADAGPDKLSCNGEQIQLGVLPKPTFRYSWNPTTGLSNPNISNPTLIPGANTHYVLTVTNEGGGCLTTDEVDVTVSNIDNTINLIGSSSFCEGSGSATLEVAPTDNIQWYKDGLIIPGATGTQYVVTQTGVYYAALSTTAGCSLNTASRAITVNAKPTPGFTPDKTIACFYNHVFNFTNNSNITPPEPLSYSWDFDDTHTADTKDVSYSFALPGTYKVKMVVTAVATGCKDSTIIPVTVNASPDRTLTFTGSDDFCERAIGKSAVLDVNPADNIQWYKDGIAIAGATATQYTATQTGTYHAVMSTVLGCSVTTDDKAITIKATPVPIITLNDPATQCFAGNSFDFTNNSTVSYGSIQYLWKFADESTNETTGNVTHSFALPGDYKVKMYVTGDEGCIDSTDVDLKVNPTPDNTLVQVGDAVICEGNSRHAELSVPATDNIQWYRDGVAITGATAPTYIVTQTGDYYATLGNSFSCNATTETKNIIFNPTPTAKFSVNNPKQCDTNNQFLFTNNSNITSGNLSYLWVFGDDNTSTDKDPVYSYKRGGQYKAKLYATSDLGCIDSASEDIVIYVSPIPEFTAKSTCENLNVLIANKTINNTNTTINYMWDFGNSYTSTLRDPVYAYPDGGRSYTIKLQVSTALCPVILNEVTHDVYIEKPQPPVRYPDISAVYNFREQLNARQIGDQYMWDPPVSLDDPRSARPLFKGIDPQLYTVKITTPRGCVTVDTQYVTTRKKIEIYVPTAFTPGGNDQNEYLQPGLMGFTKMNYFKIYDRWGKLLFETKSDRPGWNGKVNGQFVETQTVVWVIEAVDVDGKVHNKQGTTVLIR